MSDTEFHEAVFDWYHPEAQSVVITGVFDNWTGSVHLHRIENGWETKVKLPWGKKTLYKYIVDGRWTVDPTKPIEYDRDGNANNVYDSPTKPASTPTPNGTGIVQQAKETLANVVQTTHEYYTAPAVAAVTTGVAGTAALATGATKEVEPAPDAVPLVDASVSMPPSAPHKALDHTIASVQSTQEKLSSTVPSPEPSNTNPSEPHSKRGAAASLHDATASMPTTVRSAVNSGTPTVQNPLAEETSELVVDTVSRKTSKAAAAVASTIPNEHFIKLTDEDAIAVGGRPVAKSETSPEVSTHTPVVTSTPTVTKDALPTKPSERQVAVPETVKETPVTVNTKETQVPVASEASAPEAKKDTPGASPDQAFPTSGDPSSAINSSSRTDGKQKTKHSFLGKIKEIFHHKDRKSSNPR